MESKEITTEMLEKAKTASSAAELAAIAKECGMELTGEQAQKCFDQLHPPVGECADEELGNIAGGGCGKSGSAEDVTPCPQCGSTTFRKVQTTNGSGYSSYTICRYCGTVVKEKMFF